MAPLTFPPLRRAAVALAAACTALTSQAAGPLYLNNNPQNLQPLRWDTSKGPIPVYTDNGVFTFNTNGTAFLTNAQADAVTAHALKQWSSVPTSTWRAVSDPSQFVKFSDVPSIGGNVAGQGRWITQAGERTLQPGEVGPEKVYEQYNGGGLYVNYDTDGSILETYFGVGKNQVLGIAFPERAIDKDGDGYPETIVEATAVMNGWYVHVTDTDGMRVAGVFTHEFGHAINLSHSQVNGHIGYTSSTSTPRYPGVKGCVPAYYRWDQATGPKLDPSYIETMYPFINSISLIGGRAAGYEQSTVDRPDDIAAISNLYPTAAYLSSTGSITGVLRLKDGRTPYSGINIIARNVNDPLGDAVSAMSGDQSQGQLGPDGRFTIRGLKPGASYWLYTEAITAGGYPTRPMPLISEAEYWNVGESANPGTDGACAMSPIAVTAGQATQADLTFNGYAQGVQYTPIVAAFLTDLAKNGQVSAGTTTGGIAFTWDAAKGLSVLPSSVKASGGASISANGGLMAVQHDFNGNGVQSAALWNSANNRLTEIGSLNGDTCGGTGNSGTNSVTAWAQDDAGTTVVGMGYRDADGDGRCNAQKKGEILPVIWTPKTGLRMLSTKGFDNDWSKHPYLRAHAISGDGTLILGSTQASQGAVAWIGQNADPVDLSVAKDAQGVDYKITDAYASSHDGSRVAVATRNRGMLFWSPAKGVTPAAFQEVPGPQFCSDPLFPYYLFGKNVCLTETPASAKAKYGVVPVLPTDMSDDGRVVIARAGSASNGYVGMMWIEGLGWTTFREFFRKQGVAEAYALGIENPLSVNAKGNELVGGLPGISMSWYVDMKQAYVCSNGSSVQTGFPGGYVDAVKAGAKPGRCEHQ